MRSAWSVASYVYSKLPSFSLPVAAASAIPECAPSICQTPTGTYEDSCSESKVTYCVIKNLCELITHCIPYEGSSPQPASFRFPPGNFNIVLKHHNGILVPESFRGQMSNEPLEQVSTTEAIPADLKKEAFITTYQQIASATGGIMSYAPSAQSLMPLLETLSEHMLKTTQPSQPINLAFIVDNTKGMSSYIAEVKTNLMQFILQIRKKTNQIKTTLMRWPYRNAIMLRYLVEPNLTSKLDQVEAAISRLETEIDNSPWPCSSVKDAILLNCKDPVLPCEVEDALDDASRYLSWDPQANCIVVLIGGSPIRPEPDWTTIGEKLGENKGIAYCQEKGIKVYPIFVRNE